MDHEAPADKLIKGLEEALGGEFTERQVSVPMIDNLVMQHTWDREEKPGSRCLRCGVEYPNRENCP